LGNNTKSVLLTTLVLNRSPLITSRHTAAVIAAMQRCIGSSKTIISKAYHHYSMEWEKKIPEKAVCLVHRCGQFWMNLFAPLAVDPVDLMIYSAYGRAVSF